MTSRTEKVTTEKFDIVVDGRNVEVFASKYKAPNDEPRFRVSIDGSPLYIFKLDETRRSAVAIDKAEITNKISPQLEQAIGMRLAKAA